MIGTVAEAVLEVDAEIFDRLPLQLVDDAPVDAVGDGRVEANGCGQRRRIRGVLGQRLQRQRPELRCRIGLEQVRPAVHGMHRLAMR